MRKVQKPVLEQRTCSVCGEVKSLSLFYAKSSTTYRSDCKECTKQRCLQYRQKHRSLLASKQRKYYANHAEQQRQSAKVRKQKYGAKQRRKWYISSRENIKKDPKRRAVESLRSRLYNAIIKQSYKSFTTEKFLGASTEKVTKYLESKFLPGMSWNNYGKKGWHIDHIIPCVAFDLTNLEEQLKCFHYTNLQPLWWSDNLKKIRTDLKQRKEKQ